MELDEKVNIINYMLEGGSFIVIDDEEKERQNGQ